MQGFDFFEHHWILLDEACPQQVLANKKFFQAQAVPVKMGTSTTNCHAYEVYVHKVPIIVACNDWVELLLNLEKASDREWLDSNSCLCVVINKLYPSR